MAGPTKAQRALLVRNLFRHTLAEGFKVGTRTANRRSVEKLVELDLLRMGEGLQADRAFYTPAGLRLVHLEDRRRLAIVWLDLMGEAIGPLWHTHDDPAAAIRKVRRLADKYDDLAG